MRDLIRAREIASKDVRQARQRIQGFLLRYGRRYTGAVWKRSHRVWLCNQSFDHPAQQIAFQTHLNTMDQAVERKAAIEKQIMVLLPDWSLGPVVEALQSLRGVALAVAAGVVAEVGDIQGFDSPRQLSVRVAARMTPISSFCSWPALGSRLRSHEPAKAASHSVTNVAANTSKG